MSDPTTGAPVSALTGLKVLDLSRVLAGPLCGQLLGDHGASVVKVEAPAGDDTRTWGPYLPDGRSAYFEALNRNKRHICLDLRHDEDRRVLWRLVEEADVVVENFKTGTMERWGFGYESVLADRFPALVYCRITGYGVTGPLGGLPGYDAALQAYAGLMSINGEADGPPMRIGVPIVDMVTGLLAFSGVLLALQERSRSGRGQLVDCTLLDTAISLLHPHSATWLGSGQHPVRTGAAHPSIAPYETFETKAGPFFISAANDRQFRSLATVLDRPELADDPRFVSNAARLTNISDLRTVISQALSERDPEELAEALVKHGVAASPVLGVAEALGSAQVGHREMVVELEGYRGVGIPVKLSRTPGRIRTLPLEIGEETAEVLQEMGLAAPLVAAVLDHGRAAGPAIGAEKARSEA